MMFDKRDRRVASHQLFAKINSHKKSQAYDFVSDCLFLVIKFQLIAENLTFKNKENFTLNQIQIMYLSFFRWYVLVAMKDKRKKCSRRDGLYHASNKIRVFAFLNGFQCVHVE